MYEITIYIYGNENITTLFLEKYKTLYNSVPTNDSELTEIQDVIDRGISYDEFNRFRITPFIIEQCIIQLKTGKYDGSEGFNSNHLINGGHRLYVFLSLLFNCMIVHGHTLKIY